MLKRLQIINIVISNLIFFSSLLLFIGYKPKLMENSSEYNRFVDKLAVNESLDKNVRTNQKSDNYKEKKNDTRPIGLRDSLHPNSPRISNRDSSSIKSFTSKSNFRGNRDKLDFYTSNDAYHLRRK